MHKRKMRSAGGRPFRLMGSVTALAVGALLSLLGAGEAFADSAQSVARQWNDTMLSSIKKDRVRPPVQARNLFHASVAMYDAWAAYDQNARGYFFTEKIQATDVEAARHEAISYAAYRVMRSRFGSSPNVAVIYPILDARMNALGYPTTVTTTVGNSPAAVGNRIASSSSCGRSPTTRARSSTTPRRRAPIPT